MVTERNELLKCCHQTICKVSIGLARGCNYGLVFHRIGLYVCHFPKFVGFNRSKGTGCCHVDSGCTFTRGNIVGAVVGRRGRILEQEQREK